MYVLTYRSSGDAILEEMTVPEYDEMQRKRFSKMFNSDEDEEPVYPIYERVSPEYARKWVKDGGHHGTYLYVDMNGKVRRNKE